MVCGDYHLVMTGEFWTGQLCLNVRESELHSTLQTYIYRLATCKPHKTEFRTFMFKTQGFLSHTIHTYTQVLTGLIFVSQ